MSNSFNSSIRALFEPLRSLAAGGIGAAYMGIGTAFENPVRVIFIQNLTDQTVMFSFDGVDDHLPLPSNGFFLLDVTANKSINNFNIAEGDRVYVKQLGVPTTGSVYVTIVYAKHN